MLVKIGTVPMDYVTKVVIQIMTLVMIKEYVYGIKVIFQLENNAIDIKIVIVKVTIV
jgi:hypothetical protein